MKFTLKIMILTLVLCIFFAVQTAVAQKAVPDTSAKIEKKRGKNETGKASPKSKRLDKSIEKSQKEGKQKLKKDKEIPIEEKKHPGEGHAYGRNKGELSGREFGKLRSKAAKEKRDENLKRSEQYILNSEEILTESQKKIARAKKELEEKENAGAFKDKTELENRKKKIEEAEQKLELLRDEWKKEKARVEKSKPPTKE